MSFGIGDSNKKPGIFDSFRAAMTPPPLPPDDGQPIKPPTTVTVATILAMLSGLVFLLIGGVSLATTDQQLDTAVDAYNSALAQCSTEFQGFGDAVVIPQGAADDVVARGEECKKYTALTDETINSARTQNMIISAIIVVIGLIAVVGGWFLRQGARFSRLMIVGAVIISVLITMLYQVSNIFTLGATLVMIIAVMLSYIGQGGIYFTRLKARRAG